MGNGSPAAAADRRYNCPIISTTKQQRESDVCEREITTQLFLFFSFFSPLSVSCRVSCMVLYHASKHMKKTAKNTTETCDIL